jgi:hypothetical protein
MEREGKRNRGRSELDGLQKDIGAKAEVESGNGVRGRESGKEKLLDILVP